MSARARAVAVRLVLLALALASTVFGWSVSRQERTARASDFACPMHPEVTGVVPGSCPVCGMALVRRLPAELPTRATHAPPPVLPTGAVDSVRRRILSHRPVAPAWVDGDGTVSALVHDDDVAALVPDEEGTFRASAEPGRSWPLRRADDAPVAWDDSTARVRFRSLSPRGELGAGTVGWLELPERSRPALLVPLAALVDAAEGPSVMLTADGRRFTRRSVQIARTPSGLAVVQSGLQSGDRVAVRGAFFLAAEQRLGHPMEDDRR